VYDLNSHDHK